MDKNTVESSEYMGQLRRRSLAVLAWVSKQFEEDDLMGIRMMEVRIQGPDKTGGEYRAVMKGRDPSGNAVVAFANGHDVMSLLEAMKQAASTKGFLWREDKPYAPRG